MESELSVALVITRVELDDAADLLIASYTSSPVETAIRRRALAEISGALDTEALVGLAADITSQRLVKVAN